MANGRRTIRRRRTGVRRTTRRVLIGGMSLVLLLLLAVLVWLIYTDRPDLELIGEAEVLVPVGEAYTDAGAAATVRSRDVSSQIRETDDVDTGRPGTYEVTYSYDGKLGTTAVTRTVTVVDETAPELTLGGDETVYVTDFEAYEEPGATAVDDCEGNLTDQIQISTEQVDDTTREITYTVQDSSGNTATAKRTVMIDDTPPDDHVIYLTFDDGPSSDVTVEILDTLKENNIRATFFILDYSEDKLPIIQRMIEEGHTIGIHGYSHEYNEIYTSEEAFMESINKLADKLKEDTGYEAFCLRFPGGSSNTVSRHYSTGIMSRLVKLVEEEGWMYFDWNVSSGDAAGDGVASEKIISNVESELDPASNDNVVLMHDTSAKQTTADALQTIIDYGKDNGYSFYPISRNTPEVHHPVAN